MNVIYQSLDFMVLFCEVVKSLVLMTRKRKSE